MTADRRFEQDLPSLLTDLAMPVVPAYRDDIVQQVEASGQRPAWTFPERWIPMDITARRVAVAPLNWRLISLVALLVVAAIAVALVAAGASRPRPAPPYGPASNGQIAYTSHGDIFLADPATGASRAIVEGLEMDSDPRFSPDGLSLVFIRYSANGSIGLRADADGGNVHKMPLTPCSDCTGWSWAGDSRHLLITSSNPGAGITIYDTVSGESTIVDVGDAVELAAFRPPDDGEIAYVVGAPAAGPYKLVVVNRDGSDRRTIASGDEIRWFEYSPDGSKIAYEEYVWAKDRWTIHVVGSDGRGDVEFETPGDLIHQGGPQWAPDGESLLAWRTYINKGPIVSQLGLDGSLIRDFDSIVIAGDWRFAPDGSFFTYVPNGESRELNRCPLNDPQACPAVQVRLSDGFVTRLPFTPTDLNYQRRP